MASQRRSPGQSLLRRQTLRRMHGLQRHAIAGERAGFIENQGIHRSQGLKALQVAHQHTMAGQCARSSKHGHRRCQRQGTWAGDDQHSDRHHECVTRIGRPPPDSRQTRSHQHPHQEWPSDAVG